MSVDVIFGGTAFASQVNALAARITNVRPLGEILGREAHNQLTEHFERKDRTEASYLGSIAGRREHFWLQIAKSVNQPALVTDDQGVDIRIAINDPRFAQKVFGGPITAKKADALTIPVSPEAYGRSASIFEAETGWKLIRISVGPNPFTEGVLAAHENGQPGLTIEYLLRKSVTQKADPTAWPAQDAMEAALLSRGQIWVERQLQGDNS